MYAILITPTKLVGVCYKSTNENRLEVKICRLACLVGRQVADL